MITFKKDIKHPHIKIFNKHFFISVANGGNGKGKVAAVELTYIIILMGHSLQTGRQIIKRELSKIIKD